MGLYVLFWSFMMVSMTEEPSPYEVSQSGMSAPPPPEQGAVVPTSIPKVFGIIHIIYAVLGVLGALMGLAGMMLLKTLASKAGDDVQELDAMVEAFDEFAVYAYVDATLKIILGIVLLVAGIGLLKKKLWAQKASLFWAVTRIVVVVGLTIITLGPTQKFQEKVNQAGGAEQEQFQQMAQGMGNVIGVLFVCIYPVLCLIFLTKKNVRDALS